MIKQILIKCAELVNRDDIASALKNATVLSDIDNNTILNDTTRLISYYNFVVENIFENYLKIEENEILTSDENNRIYFSNFKYKPVKIKKVLNTNNSDTLYFVQVTFISTNSPNQEYRVYYNYVPSSVGELTDEINYPKVLSDKIICYGVISEFLASKDQFEKSEFWKNKFLYELFKFKTRKERRLKSTF